MRNRHNSEYDNRYESNKYENKIVERGRKGDCIV